MIKKHLTGVKVFDIQLSRSGIFTLYATDVKGPPPPQEWTRTSDGPIELKFSVHVG
jgi:hypothetical protein